MQSPCKVKIVNIHTQEESYIQGADGQPFEFESEVSAQKAIDCMNMSVGRGQSTEPKNFKYAIDNDDKLDMVEA